MTIDLRRELQRATWSIGTRAGDPSGATLHYNGPPVAGAGTLMAELKQLAADARYHITGPLHADGIQYHWAVLCTGEWAQLRDERAILWHAANRYANTRHIAIHLPLGGAQQPTDAQWAGACALFEDLAHRYRWYAADGRVDRTVIKGHREWPRSDGKPQKSCPGPIVTRLLNLWRGQAEVANRFGRVAVAWALIRQGPGQQYKVALDGTAKLPKGASVEIDAVVTGTPPKGSTDARWAHLASGLGFLHVSVLEAL